jgi:hypothetical protein
VTEHIPDPDLSLRPAVERPSDVDRLLRRAAVPAATALAVIAIAVGADAWSSFWATAAVDADAGIGLRLQMLERGLGRIDRQLEQDRPRPGEIFAPTTPAPCCRP